MTQGKDLYRLFFEEASEALIAVDIPSGTFFAVNKAFVSMVGVSREELEGEPVVILGALSVDHGSEAKDERERGFDMEILGFPGYYNEVRLSTRDGYTRYVTVRVRHVQLGSKNLALAVITDDTERQLLIRDLAAKHQSLESAYADLEKMHKQLQTTQEQMMQASKLMALGELAAGMSHELNQPLTGIRGFAQEALDVIKTSQKPSKKHVSELLAEVVVNSDKMAGLLSQLRAFARKEKNAGSAGGNLKLEAVPVSQSFHSVLSLLKRQLETRNIKITWNGLDAGAENLAVLAQAHPVEQILINLITNSRDAIGDRQKSNPKAVGLIHVDVTHDSKWVDISVSDNGPGIPESIRANIFDPFFSTKETGQGMGLGLSISYGIAHRFGGELALDRSGPMGTTFRLRLPYIDARDSGSSPSGSSDSGSSPSGSSHKEAA